MRSETGDIPNKYTVYMGEMVRKAREEMGMSQEELGEKIFRKRLAVSEMENGKVEISAWVLPYLSNTLNKPISFFFPKNLNGVILENELVPLEHELITSFRGIQEEHLSRVAIDLVKVIAEFDPTDILVDRIDIALDKKEQEKEIEKFIKSMRKK